MKTKFCFAARAALIMFIKNNYKVFSALWVIKVLDLSYIKKKARMEKKGKKKD